MEINSIIMSPLPFTEIHTFVSEMTHSWWKSIFWMSNCLVCYKNSREATVVVTTHSCVSRTRRKKAQKRARSCLRISQIYLTLLSPLGSILRWKLEKQQKKHFIWYSWPSCNSLACDTIWNIKSAPYAQDTKYVVWNQSWLQVSLFGNVVTELASYFGHLNIWTTDVICVKLFCLGHDMQQHLMTASPLVFLPTASSLR